jgi:hypothetical protein
VKFGRKREFTDEEVEEIRSLCESGVDRAGHHQADRVQQAKCLSSL